MADNPVMTVESKSISSTGMNCSGTQNHHHHHNTIMSEEEEDVADDSFGDFEEAAASHDTGSHGGGGGGGTDGGGAQAEEDFFESSQQQQQQQQQPDLCCDAGVVVGLPPVSNTTSTGGGLDDDNGGDSSGAAAAFADAAAAVAEVASVSESDSFAGFADAVDDSHDEVGTSLKLMDSNDSNKYDIDNNCADDTSGFDEYEDAVDDSDYPSPNDDIPFSGFEEEEAATAASLGMPPPSDGRDGQGEVMPEERMEPEQFQPPEPAVASGSTAVQATSAVIECSSSSSNSVGGGGLGFDLGDHAPTEAAASAAAATWQEANGSEKMDVGTETAAPVLQAIADATEQFGDCDRLAAAAAPNADVMELTEMSAVDTEFDAFGDTVVEASAAPTATEAAISAANPDEDEMEGDDFGAGFETTTTTAEEEEEGAVVDPEEDDFGGFDIAAPATHTEDAHAIDLGHDQAIEESAAAAPAAAAEDPGGDNFFDLDAAAQSNAGSLAMNVQEGGNTFGDLTALAPAVPSNTVETDDDDDFGDFDTAVPMNTTAEEAAADEEEEGDDDFGDFDAAPIASGEAEAADDDFGDFDAAPEAAASGMEGVDDDDFGDFDEAPTGNDTATTQPTVFPSGSEDHLLQKLRLVFPTLFAQYGDASSPAKNDHDTDGGGTYSVSESDDVVTIQSVLTRLDVQTEKLAEDRSSRVLLDKLFLDTSMFGPKAPSRFIVSEEGGGQGPFDHTSYPVGGMTSTRARSQQQKLMDSPYYLPDVLVSIHLPTSDDFPVDYRAPPLAALRQAGESVAPTTVILPPKDRLKTVSTSSELDHHREPSEQAKTFLQRIPDLSYMLSSRLSLPNKK